MSLHTYLEGVKVGEEVLDLLGGEDVAESGHVGLAVLDDLGDAIIVGGQTAGQILPLEHMFEAGTLQILGGVSFVAAGAIIIEDAAAGGLLRIEAEFGVGFAALHIAGGEQGDQQGGKAEQE